MLLAMELSARRGRIGFEEVEDLRDLLQDIHLPVVPPADMSAMDFLGYMARDKKVVDDGLRLVLLDAIGHARVVDDVSERELTDLLETAVPAA
jgi:3-dehydroquinate synthase